MKNRARAISVSRKKETVISVEKGGPRAVTTRAIRNNSLTN